MNTITNYHIEYKIDIVTVNLDSSISIAYSVGYTKAGIFNTLQSFLFPVPDPDSNGFLDSVPNGGLSRRDDLNNNALSYLISKGLIDLGS